MPSVVYFEETVLRNTLLTEGYFSAVIFIIDILENSFSKAFELLLFSFLSTLGHSNW